MQRRYLQGTLDFACGIYAVVNALACAHGLDLAGSKYVFQETLLSLSEEPSVWKSFLRNETDHYWLVRYMLQRWCREQPWELVPRQPFSDCLLPGGREPDLTRAEMFLPEKENDSGPVEAGKARKEAEAVWRALEEWFLGRNAGRSDRPVLLRFHRFLYHDLRPVVSHWTTAHTISGGALLLHDASSEKNALFALEKNSLMPESGDRGLIRIVPESLVLLEPKKKRPVTSEEMPLANGKRGGALEKGNASAGSSFPSSGPSSLSLKTFYIDALHPTLRVSCVIQPPVGQQPLVFFPTKGALIQADSGNWHGSC